MRRFGLSIVLISLLISCESLPICQHSKKANVATFNIRIFSTGSRDDDKLHRICDILRRYDFIAIQETRDTTILDRAVRMLLDEFGLAYEYIASPEIGRGVKEIYAFLYRSDLVAYSGESAVWPDPGDQFIREPYYALFRVRNFDFYAITVHTLCRDSIGERRAETQLLDEVYESVQDMNDENDVILLGDFNLEPLDSGFEGLRSIPNMFYVNPDVPTSIKDNLYDNIWFQSNYTTEYSDTFGVFKFDEEIYGNNDSVASLAVSDHRPLWA